MDKEKPKCLPTNPTNYWPAQRVYVIHQVWHPLGIQQHSNQTGRRMEGGLPHAWRSIWTNSHVFRVNQLPGDIPNDDEHHFSKRSGPRMAIGIHGQHCHPYKAIQWRNGTTTQTTAQTTDPSSTWKIGNTRPIPQIREMQILEMRNWILGSHRWKWSP